MAFLGGLFGGNPPTPPDPNAVSQAQLGYNQQAAQMQQRMNMLGQQTPYGSLSWSADPNAPGGYTATQALSPAQQQLLNLQQQGQTGLGTAAAGLGGQIGGMYGQMPNLDSSAMTNQLMDWQTQSMQPYWDIQKSNLQASLQNQGLSPNDPAWQNAMMAFTKGIGQARNEMFAQAEPLAFQQTMQKYQFPLQIEQQLQGAARPQGPSFVQTPTEQIQPPNYQGAAQNQWQALQQQYQNQQAGLGQLFGIGGSLLAAPFTGGASLFGALPSFAGGWGGGGGGSAPTVLGGSF